MIDQEKIKALAELDGWVCDKDGHWGINPDESGEPQFYPNRGLHPNYFTSYDAIIPLIQKQRTKDQFFVVNFWKALHKLWHNGEDIQFSEGDAKLYYFGSNTVHWCAFDSTPLQLADALLIATGKMTV